MRLPIKPIVTVAIVALLVWAMWWLWQRQPKPKEEQKATGSGQEKQEAKKEEAFSIKPADFSVLTSVKVKFEGKATPNSYLAIFSNKFQDITKTESNGAFQKEITLGDDLNLIEVVTSSTEFKQEGKKSLTLLVAGDTTSGNNVYAGSVKTTFDTLITLSTVSGQKTVRTNKSTTISLPKEEKETQATGSAFQNIRVGDYLIAQGNIAKEDELTAQKVEVIRENKPQNTRELVLTKTLTASRQNLFSAKDQENKIIEFTLSKNSQVLVDGKQAESSDIAKGKNAIIIFHQQDKQKVVDLIYLLP